jgi:hypothetical protein
VNTATLLAIFGALSEEDILRLRLALRLLTNNESTTYAPFWRAFRAVCDEKGATNQTWGLLLKLLRAL